MIQNDISFVSNGRPGEIDNNNQLLPSAHDDLGIPRTSRLSSEMSFDGRMSSDYLGRHSSFSQDSFGSVGQNISMVISFSCQFKFSIFFDIACDIIGLLPAVKAGYLPQQKWPTGRDGT